MDREYPERPIVGVGALVIQDDRILLVRRGRQPQQGEWSLPGGALELGETLHSAVIREVKEETSINVRPTEVIEVFERILPDHSGRLQFHYVLIDYLCDVIGGELAAGSDVSDACWAMRGDLDRSQVVEFTRRVIEKAFAVKGMKP